MIIIIDDVFNENDINFIRENIPLYPTNDTWFDKGKNNFIDIIIDQCSKYFDLSGMIGYEMHKNIIGPDYHQDKDELLFLTKGIKSFPLCGIVYYPLIENLSGGELKFENLSVKPINNRLVIFSPSLPHMVNPHKGTRISLGINPWNSKPLAYR
jgi:hypothetical protein